MKMNKSKQLEISKELVSTSMENISNKIRSTLITYVNNWNQLCLGLVISYLGIDSLDTKEALKRIDSRQVETIIHSAKLFNKSCDMTTRFVELLLSYANVSLEEDYKNIKEKLQHLDKKVQKNYFILLEKKHLYYKKNSMPVYSVLMIYRILMTEPFK